MQRLGRQSTLAKITFFAKGSLRLLVMSLQDSFHGVYNSRWTILRHIAHKGSFSKFCWTGLGRTKSQSPESSSTTSSYHRPTLPLMTREVGDNLRIYIPVDRNGNGLTGSHSHNDQLVVRLTERALTSCRALSSTTVIHSCSDVPAQIPAIDSRGYGTNRIHPPCCRDHHPCR